MSTAWTAQIATNDRSRRVDVSALLVDFAGVVRHLAGGEWEATLPATVWPQLVNVWPAQDEAPLLFGLRHTDTAKGMIVSGNVRSATIERDANGVEEVKLAGVDEWASVLGSRIVWPQPADLPPWSTSDYDTVTGQASAAIADLIATHVGSNARTERVIDGVTVVDEGAGPTGTWRYRLTNLGVAVADIAEQAGLVVDVRRALTGGVTVTVGDARQRTAVIVDETKLADYSVTMTASDPTTVIAAGTGDGTARLFAISGEEVAGAARRETFSDQRNISTQPMLDESARATRSAGSASTSLSGSLLETSGVRWREQYRMGDTITMAVGGTRWTVPVTAVTVKVDATNGLRVSPVLGKASRFALTQLIRDVAGIGARLNSLEVS